MLNWEAYPCCVFDDESFNDSKVAFYEDEKVSLRAEFLIVKDKDNSYFVRVRFGSIRAEKGVYGSTFLKKGYEQEFYAISDCEDIVAAQFPNVMLSRCLKHQFVCEDF